MQSAQRLQEIAVKTSTVEDIINGEMNTFLRANSFIGRDEFVRVKLPVGETFMLPIELRKESDEERLVLHIL